LNALLPNASRCELVHHTVDDMAPMHANS
jgi:hypothetical protein